MKILLYLPIFFLSSCSGVDLNKVKLENKLSEFGYVYDVDRVSPNLDLFEITAFKILDHKKYLDLVEKLELKNELAEKEMLFVRPVGNPRVASISSLDIPKPLEQVKSGNLFSKKISRGFVSFYFSDDGQVFIFIRGSFNDVQTLLEASESEEA